MPSILQIGAGWHQVSQSGGEFIAVTIDAPCQIILKPGERLCLFPNEQKQHDRAPDYRLVVMPEREPAPQRPNPRRQTTQDDDLDNYADDFQAPAPRPAAPQQPQRPPQRPQQAGTAPSGPPPRYAAPRQPQRAAPRPPRPAPPADDYDEMAGISDPFAE